MASKNYSIVEYYAEHEGYRCGYCKSTNTNYSHGMWAHRMSVQDYQDLIDRGWRRSGLYCYKPTMNVTCCPMYTIKCEALNFRPSKSQKKVIKRIHRYLSHGNTKCDDGNSMKESSQTVDMTPVSEIPDLPQKILDSRMDDVKVLSVDPSISSQIEHNVDENIECAPPNKNSYEMPEPQTQACQPGVSTHDNSFKPGCGADLSRPPCKKAKLARIERKQQKLLGKGYTKDEVKTMVKKNPVPNESKSLEDFMNEELPCNPAHRLEVRLVRSCPPSNEFEQTFREAFSVYRKYQMSVHNDPPEKCTQRQYTRFLVNSPLQVVIVDVKSEEFRNTLYASYTVFLKYQKHVHNESAQEWRMDSFIDFLIESPLLSWKPSDGPPQGYGSFHQQYWLDGKLIAVGVLDILPRCISSVYFYYDPDFADLSLGTYASLRELALTRSLHHHASSLQYYYMGFYIHTCPKMRYKANYWPSYLLCPETYDWFPVQECKKKLDVNKYSRLNNDDSAVDKDGQVDINEVLVLYNHSAMPYIIYKAVNPACDDADEVEQYSKLVGKKCAKSMLLARM